MYADDTKIYVAGSNMEEVDNTMDKELDSFAFIDEIKYYHN